MISIPIDTAMYAAVALREGAKRSVREYLDCPRKYKSRNGWLDVAKRYGTASKTITAALKADIQQACTPL